MTYPSHDPTSLNEGSLPCSWAWCPGWAFAKLDFEDERGPWEKRQVRRMGEGYLGTKISTPSRNWKLGRWRNGVSSHVSFSVFTFSVILLEIASIFCFSEFPGSLVQRQFINAIAQQAVHQASSVPSPPLGGDKQITSIGGTGCFIAPQI